MRNAQEGYTRLQDQGEEGPNARGRRSLWAAAPAEETSHVEGDLEPFDAGAARFLRQAPRRLPPPGLRSFSGSDGTVGGGATRWPARRMLSRRPEVRRAIRRRMRAGWPLANCLRVHLRVRRRCRRSPVRRPRVAQRPGRPGPQRFWRQCRPGPRRVRRGHGYRHLDRTLDRSRGHQSPGPLRSRPARYPGVSTQAPHHTLWLHRPRSRLPDSCLRGLWAH